MNYISQSPIHRSKCNLKYVLNCCNYPEKKGNGYMSKINLVLALTDKRGRKHLDSQFLTQTD